MYEWKKFFLSVGWLAVAWLLAVVDLLFRWISGGCLHPSWRGACGRSARNSAPEIRFVVYILFYSPAAAASNFCCRLWLERQGGLKIDWPGWCGPRVSGRRNLLECATWRPGIHCCWPLGCAFCVINGARVRSPGQEFPVMGWSTLYGFVHTCGDYL